MSTCDKIYFCPTSGTFECCPEHSGFDECCDRPEEHIPVHTESGES